MSEAARSGPFWDMIEGRAPMPPVARLLGWTLLSIDPGRGEIRVRFEARTDFLNPAGTVQGGILSAMLDDTMGPAAVALLGGNRFTQTLELKTSFYRPAGQDRSSALAASRTAGANWSFSKGRCRTAKESHSRRRRRPPASSSLRPSNKLLPAVVRASKFTSADCRLFTPAKRSSECRADRNPVCMVAGTRTSNGRRTPMT